MPARARRRRRSERGAAAVELAIVTPVIMIVVFGIIEMSFVVRDYAAVTSDVRVAARLASASADAGPAACLGGADAPPCTPQSAPALAQLAADAIQRGGSAMPEDNIDYLLIYKANAQGYPGADGNQTMPATCGAISNCVRFVWSPSLDRFRYAEGTWTSSTISACFPGTPANPLDRVGVYLRATHRFLTNIFGSTMRVSDRAVMNFEPLATQNCGKGQHQ